MDASLAQKNYCTADRIKTAECYEWMQNEGADVNKTALLMFCQQMPNDMLCSDVNNHAEQIVNRPVDDLEFSMFKVMLLILIYIVCIILIYRVVKKPFLNKTGY